MIKFIKKYLIPFTILTVFQAGFFYLILALIFSEPNPLSWHPIVYTIFFEVILFIMYINYRALTDDDDFPKIMGIYE